MRETLYACRDETVFGSVNALHFGNLIELEVKEISVVRTRYTLSNMAATLL